jgi:hypothetical protein
MRTQGLPGAFFFLLIIACVFAFTNVARAALEIVGPREVEERYIHRFGASVYLVVDGRQWDLITDPHSPLVSSLGDGSFHPMRRGLVRDAIEDVQSEGVSLHGKILILPYPRQTTLKSSCEGNTIFLSPGIREVVPEHVHATVAHEIGHLLQHQRLRRTGAAWATYLDRRGLNEDLYHAGAAHRDRPSEIFAEDFRFFFGGALATTSGRIENPDLPLPNEIPGFEDWFRGVLARPSHGLLDTSDARPAIFPNPYRATHDDALRVRFHAAAHAGASHADIFDVTGRLVRTVPGEVAETTSVEFRWNGRDASGRNLASGIYFVRWRENPAAGTARVQVLR